MCRITEYPISRSQKRVNERTRKTAQEREASDSVMTCCVSIKKKKHSIISNRKSYQQKPFHIDYIYNELHHQHIQSCS